MNPTQGRRYDGAIFDLDGTLADTLQTIAAALNHGLSQVGRPTLPLERVARIVGEGVATLCVKALDGEAAHLAEPLLLHTRAFYQRNPMHECRLYPGIAAMLDALRDGGVALAVLSNKPHDLTIATLAGLGVEGFFVRALGHREEFPRKPDPTSVRWLLSELALPPARVLYVGDTPIDLETARAAGLDSAAVTWGFRSIEELRPHRPRFEVETPARIVELCLRGG